jgi:hypothetical protein
MLRDGNVSTESGQVQFVYENLHDLTSSYAENGQFHRPGINPRHKMLCC